MKRINYIQVITAMFLMLLISSCYYDQSIVEPIVPDPNEEVSFANDIIPIFNASCNAVGCHNASGPPPDLTPATAYNSLINGNYIDVTDPQNSELYQWMAGNRNLPMPLTGADATYNAKVLSWITQGASNN